MRKISLACVGALVWFGATQGCGSDDSDSNTQMGEPDSGILDSGTGGAHAGGGGHAGVAGVGGSAATGGAGGRAGAAGTGAASGAGGVAGAAGAAGTGATAGQSGAGGTGANLDVAGYWLWEQHVENNEVVLEITEADLEQKIGPSGWPGCPNNVICTHYGILKLAFGDSRAHYIFNVTTSSDFQIPGTYSVDGSVVHFTGTERYSCAHPDSFDHNQRDQYFLARREGDRLRVSVTQFGSSDLPFFSEPPQDPARWIVFRQISREEFYGEYMIRMCQPTPEAPTCNEGCYSDSLVD